jgi:hypothetical protein
MVTETTYPDNPEANGERPWTQLNTPQGVEAWIEEHNRKLLQSVAKNATGYGVCFHLSQGGEIFMHTAEDAILLDVTPDAEWVKPVITAATGVSAPNSQIWILPDDKLTQLALGLDSLIGSSRMVVSHNFKAKKC